MYCMYLNPTHRVANKLVSLKRVSLSLSDNGCDSRPCQNGGSCVESGTNYYQCICSDGYIGSNCQTGMFTSETVTFPNNYRESIVPVHCRYTECIIRHMAV